MRTTLVNCPYCNSNQKIFHISYNLKKFLNNFKQEKIFILGTNNKKQEKIKKFNCNKCSETLFIYYDIEKSQYLVNGKRLEELRNAILEKKRGIGILKKKLVENINKQIKDFLRIKSIKEEEELNHLIQEEKELTERAPKEDTQV
jgi:DNA-directed RNA polymerase subunit RPC12/RpoP